MPPTLTDIAAGLAGLLILWAASLPMLLAGNAEAAFLIYSFQQVMR